MKDRELFFSSHKFNPKEAHEIGSVLRTFPDETHQYEVNAIAKSFSRKAPLAIGEMKKYIINTENTPLRNYIELETEHHSRPGASEDSREAFKAFVEKR